MGGVPHLRRRHRAVLLHDRVDDVRLEDDVRLLARPRGTRTPTVEARVQAGPDPDLHRVGNLRAGFLDPFAGALVWFRRLLRLDGGCRDRALHRLRAADHPAAAGGREVRAWSLAPRQVLQGGGLDRDPLDLLHLHRVPAPVLPGRHSVQVELRLEPAQLHAAAGVCIVRAVRRLVRPVRA